MTQDRAGLIFRVRRALDTLLREAAKFGVIGALAFVVDAGLYNVLVHGWDLAAVMRGAHNQGPMADIPVRAKIVATAVATAFSWVGNRYWTYRHSRRENVGHEAMLFLFFNVIGLAIAAACLAFARYVLRLDGFWADNFWGNGVGLVLGTLFRFWAYRTYVFKGEALADDVPIHLVPEEDSEAHQGAEARGERAPASRAQRA